MKREPLLEPVLLSMAANEFAAEAMVRALEAEGVRAWTVGGTPLEYAAPVRVMVLGADLEVAHAVLAAIGEEAAGTDWESECEREPMEAEVAQAAASPATGRRRLPIAGLGVAGSGGVLIGAKDHLFAAMPAGTRAMPGAVMVALGVAWAVGRARRGSG